MTRRELIDECYAALNVFASVDVLDQVASIEDAVRLGDRLLEALAYCRREIARTETTVCVGSPLQLVRLREKLGADSRLGAVEVDAAADDTPTEAGYGHGV